MVDILKSMEGTSLSVMMEVWLMEMDVQNSVRLNLDGLANLDSSM